MLNFLNYTVNLARACRSMPDQQHALTGGTSSFAHVPVRHGLFCKPAAEFRRKSFGPAGTPLLFAAWTGKGDLSLHSPLASPIKTV